MTRKPNFAKFIFGVFVLALLFIGTWATSHAPRSTATKAKITKNVSNKITVARANGGKAGSAVPQDPPSWNAVFEIDGDAADPTPPQPPQPPRFAHSPP